MRKLPAKQIYILAIIVVGIIALSIYSTYAIFTFESETGDVVSINTPNSINLFVNSYEYKKVTIPKNDYISLDMDLYNNTDEALCYGAWYKANESLIDKIKVYEKNDNTISTSGIIDPISNKRISLLLINDNDEDVSIKIGLSYEPNSEKCSLGVADNRLSVTEKINHYENIATTLTSKLDVLNNDEGYLTYKYTSGSIALDNNQKIFIAKEFTYHNEVFTLTNPSEIEPDKLKEYTKHDTYYTCLTNDNCNYLYKINHLHKEQVDENSTNVSIDNYDTLIGYLEGKSGLRKIDNSYVYYGDNPHNFIYYNCQNEMNEKTCELWRIIGFYYNEKDKKYTTKIIRDTSINVHNYDEDNNLWPNSDISVYLNNDYKLYNKNNLIDVTFKQENIIDDDIILLDNENTSLVTLMNVSDYLNASVCETKKISEYDQSCFKNNWLNNNETLPNLTMSIKYEKPSTDSSEEEIIPSNDTVYVVGTAVNNVPINEKHNIRPVVYLKSRTISISGNGTIDSPYIIK